MVSLTTVALAIVQTQASSQPACNRFYQFQKKQILKANWKSQISFGRLEMVNSVSSGKMFGFQPCLLKRCSSACTICLLSKRS